MDLGLFCDSCKQSFDTQDKIPIILLCGHTVCRECALKTQRDCYCKLCDKPQVIEDFTALKVNQKLFIVLQKTIQPRGSSTGGNTVDSNQPLLQQQLVNTSTQNQPRPLYSFQSGHITNQIPSQYQQQMISTTNSSQQNFPINKKTNINVTTQNAIQNAVALGDQVFSQSKYQEGRPLESQSNNGNLVNLIQTPSGTPQSAQKKIHLTDENASNSNFKVKQFDNNQQNQHQYDIQSLSELNLSSAGQGQISQIPDKSQIQHNKAVSISQEQSPQNQSQPAASSYIQIAPERTINQENIPDNRQSFISPLSDRAVSGTPQTQNPINQTINQNNSQLQLSSQQFSAHNSSQKNQRQLCKMHFDRVIEYFCQQCNFSVCSKCMFLHHNGHDLKQLEDALKIMKAKLQQFDHSVNETLRENNDAKIILKSCKKQVEEMRDKQFEIIENRFKEFIQKIEDRKAQLCREILHKYETSIFKINDKMKMIEEQFEELNKAQSFYVEPFNLLQDENFLRDEGSQQQVTMLERVPEFDKFVYENSLKIKGIIVAQRNTKVEYQEGISIGLKPIELTLNNALNLIQTLNFDNYSSELSQIHSFVNLPPKDLAQRQIRLINQNSIKSSTSLNQLPNLNNINSNNNSTEPTFSFPKNNLNTNGSPHQFQNIQIPPLTMAHRQNQIDYNQNQARSRSQQNSQQHSLDNIGTHQSNQNLIYQQQVLNQQPIAYPHNNYQVSHLNQINQQQIQSSQIHLNFQNNNQPINQYQVTYPQLQESDQNFLMNSQQHQQLLQLQNLAGQSNSSSKFAKLKFNRQPTSELTLQLETPHQVKLAQTQDNQRLENNKTPQNNEKISPIKKQLTEEEKIAQDELQSQKIKLIDNAIYCVGDNRFFLQFDFKNQLWHQIYFDKSSHYQGDLKFSSICQINLKKREFLMTGGCNKSNLEASSQCYKFGIGSMRLFREVQKMKNARYGHASVFINQLVLVLGGFNHRDDEAQAPQTLNICEKYSIKENQWTPIAPMLQERAYFSAARVKEEFIYVFGGFLNYETTNSIEFYNIMLDKWTLLSIIMPIKLAKYGLAKIEENQIVIAGGLFVDNSSTRTSSDTGSAASFSQMNTVYKFDCNTLKWTKLAKLNFRRTMYSNMPVKENMQIFAIGGTVEGTNEVYDIRKKKWNACQSYTSILGQNDLQTYAICSLSKFSED